MHIVVTGGAGYVGSVTCAALLEAGHTVIAIDDLSEGHQESIPQGATLIRGDIANFDTLIPVDQQVDAVVHLAGSIAAGESMNVPEKYWQNNTISTLKLLDAMRKRNIKKLVFASTAAVYGEPSEIPLTENAITTPTNTYGMTKLAIDMAITSESWAYALDATSLRFFNVAGAYKQFGERHKHETHIIPLLLEVAAGKRDGFTIFGDDYDTPDGTCQRDYIHVYDLARAISMSLETNHPGEHHIYNLANGSGFTNKQVVDVVKQVTGVDFPVTTGPRRAGDPATLIATSQKAKEELGWEPSIPTLEAMVSDAWEFAKQQ